MRGKSFGMRGESPGLARKACLLALGMALALLAGPGASTALAEPPVLWGEEPLVCPSGSEAGQCANPRGVAGYRENGHLFVANQSNQRVEEFNALGQFIKAWGWGVDTGAAESEVCTAASTCQPGLAGGGAGQFSKAPMGVAVDSAGNVYVQDWGNSEFSPVRRVQKFDPDGGFLLMFGGEVNKTQVEEREAQEAAPEPVTVTEEEENLCPFDPGDECKAGTVGTGQGQFGEWEIGDHIAIEDKGTAADADDTVYVGDENRIQEFDTGGHYQGEFAVAGNVRGLDVDTAGNLYAIYGGAIHKYTPGGVPAPTAFAVANPSAVAVDSAGHVFAFQGGTNPICELAPDGSLIECFGGADFSSSTGLATNLCPESEPPGNLYVTNFSLSNAFLRAYGTEPVGCFKARTGPPSKVQGTTATLNGTVNPRGEVVTECFFEWGESEAYGQIAQCEDPNAGEIGTGSTPVPVHAALTGLTKGAIYHFRLIAEVGGEPETGADEVFKTLGPPVISNEHTVLVTQTEARLRALVNPEGFATTCNFEYGGDDTYGQSTPIQAVGKDRSEHAVFADLDSLTPGAEYHWRIACQNQSGPAEGVDHVLFTYRPFVPEDGCSNQPFRRAAAALLPDCRAYEMVTPVDKNGGDIVREQSGVADPGGYVQAATDGDSLTYTTNAAFSETATFRFNQYLAARTERGEPGEGWWSEGINPPVAGQPVKPVVFGFFREFMAFTPDLCSAWLIDNQTPAPTTDGQAGRRNLYRRENCGADAGELEALIPEPAYQVPSKAPPNYVDNASVQGHSADGRHTVFVVFAQLTDETSPGGVYDRFEGELHLASVLSDGASGDPAPGDGMGFGDPAPTQVGSGWARSLERAVSEDGSRVYWSGSGNQVYLRLHPEQGIVAGECTDNEAVACTVPVSAGSATFRSAAVDGSAALYSEGGDLYEFSLERYEAGGEASRLIAASVVGVAGASEDLARIYFVSKEAIPGAGANSEGEEALGGEPNLYLAEGGGFSFIGTLAAGDVGQLEPCCTVTAYNLASLLGYTRAVRVSADGGRIAFNSRARLSGYDNTDSASGKPAVEVYLYDVGAGELTCASCNPGRARPRGARELTEPYFPPRESRGTGVLAAAWIPTAEQPLHTSNALSADGNRLFFNSNDALLPRDANGAQDVYEWEAPGTGGCTTKSPSYFAQNGGCIYLISSGDSAEESEFWEASPDGEDVFFATSSNLLPADPGNVDLYDARIGGGFPEPPPRIDCEGEACQGPPVAPEFPTPASSAYSGPANPHQAKGRRCPKGKRKVRRGGKVRCVKKGHAKKQKQRGRRAGQDRRAGR